MIDASKPDEFAILQASGAEPTTIPLEKIRYATFCGGLLLEEGESPYKHGHFPLVAQYCYKSGWATDDDGLEPAGVVRDLKDPQRELNKNRNENGYCKSAELGCEVLARKCLERLKGIQQKSTTPGANIFLPQSVTFEDGLPASQSVGNIELENEAKADFYDIWVTPESLSGSVGQMSGKAIDLRQSVTTVQTAEIFDNAKESEREIVKISRRKRKPGTHPAVL